MAVSSLASPGYLLILLGISIPTVYISATTIRLLRQYPATDIDPSHPAYTSANDFRWKQTDCHWFSARIPARLLRPVPNDKDDRIPRKKKPLTEVELWTSAFFSTPTISLESSVIGLATGNGFRPGYQGAEGLKAGQVFAHGAFLVSSVDKPNNRVIVSYVIPDGPAKLWERAALWGWPYKHISQGRHCFEVEYDQPRTNVETAPNEEEELVTVRLGCVIDIERRNRFTGEEDGKVMPGFYVFFHEMYARWLVDGAIERLKKMHRGYSKSKEM